MGISLSKSASSATLTNFQDFDGIGLTRPAGLPSPTPQSRKKLTQLLLANHHNYSLLYADARAAQNTLAHALVSLYYLGASAAQLYAAYEQLIRPLAEWQEDSPQEVTLEDWQDFIGDKDYVRGFFDFYREKIQDDSSGMEWKATAHHFLTDKYDDEESHETGSLFAGLFGGSANAIIHLGYASELDNWELAAEALTLASTEYDTYGLDKLLVSAPPLPNQPATTTTSTPQQLLQQIHDDSRLDDVAPGMSVAAIAEKYHDVILEYTQALRVTPETVDATLRQLLHVAVLQVFPVQSGADTPGRSWGPVRLQLLASLHSIIEIGTLVTDIHNGGPATDDGKTRRTVEAAQVVIPRDHFVVLVHNYWVLFVALYIAQSRPLSQIDAPREEATFKSYGDTVPNQDDIWAVINSLILPTVNSKNPLVAEDSDGSVFTTVRALLFASQYLGPESSYFYAKAAWIIAITM